MKSLLRLGTRGSPLALIQAEEVRQKLFQAHPHLIDETEIEIVPIHTTGDWKPAQKEKRFIELGGNKGLFTKEIEEALLGDYVDIAVHSMKDVEGQLPDGLEIAAMLERADPRDAFIGYKARTLDALPAGSSVGTSSLRRQAQILARRPDLRVVPLRGNVDTRLAKLAEGRADATLLAVAGLARLNLGNRISSVMETDIMLPAAGQGALGVQIRSNDSGMKKLLAPLNMAATFDCVSAERALLRVLDGSCETPIGALARMTGKDEMILDALVAKPDGTAIVRLNRKGNAKDFIALGTDLGHELKVRLPPGFLPG